MPSLLPRSLTDLCLRPPPLAVDPLLPSLRPGPLDPPVLKLNGPAPPAELTFVEELAALDSPPSPSSLSSFQSSSLSDSRKVVVVSRVMVFRWKRGLWKRGEEVGRSCLASFGVPITVDWEEEGERVRGDVEEGEPRGRGV